MRWAAATKEVWERRLARRQWAGHTGSDQPAPVQLGVDRKVNLGGCLKVAVLRD